MPPAQSSEFSFGFAYSREVVATCWAALGGHPVLPSLYDEGQAGGFDVAIGLLPVPDRSRAGLRQHELLLALAEQSVFHIVECVAPRFHTNAALSAAFADEEVVDR